MLGTALHFYLCLKPIKKHEDMKNSIFVFQTLVQAFFTETLVN